MRCRTERLFAGTAAAVVVAIAMSACDVTSSPSPSATASSPTPAVTGPTPMPESPRPMSGSPSAAVEMPDAGRPFDGPTILAQMRTSPRPDGVPDRLETDAIAAAVADAIWTFDGMPWTTMAIGASCGETTCLLDVAGSRPTATAEDLWVFEVEPTTAAVRVVTAELRAIPPETVAQLDRLARGGVSEPGALDAMALTTARWTPPPEPARFLLSYRTGGEEGSCAAELAIDGATGRVVTETFVDC